jgi:hypothetical protein
MPDAPATSAPDPTPAAQSPAHRVPRGFFLAGEILACDLTPAEKLLLGLMSTLARQSGQSYASVDTYSRRLGVNSRTVQRLLRDLERRGFIVQDRPGGGGRVATVYRLMPAVVLPRQNAAPTGKDGPGTTTSHPRQFAAPTHNGCGDKSGAQPRQNVPGCGDKSGGQPRQNTTQDVDEGRFNNRREGERPPSPGAHDAGNNGDGNGGLQEQQDPDAALMALAEAVCGRPFTAALRASFVQSVSEARAKGATDAGIAGGIKKAGPEAAPWDGPNLARDAAGGRLVELLASYQRAAHLPKPRATLAEIVADIRYARKGMARTPQPSAGDDAAALWRSQIAWADAHPEALSAELRRPELAVAGVPA